MKAFFILFGILLAPTFAAPSPGEADARTEGADGAALAALLKKTDTPPLKIPATSITTAKFGEQIFAWMQRAILPAINKELDGAADDPKKRAAIEKILRIFLLLEQTATNADAIETVSSLVAPEMNAPVIQFFLAEVAAAMGKADEAGARMKIAARAKENESALTGLLATSKLVGLGMRDKATTDRFTTLFRSALSKEQCPEADAHFIVNLLCDRIDDSALKFHAAAIVDTVADATGPEWARHTLIGKAEIADAWNHRGGAVAAAVGEDGWKGFGIHLGAAREALTQAWELRKDRPEAAALMIMVLGGGGSDDGENMRLWLDRAVAAQCDYRPPYSGYLWFKRPRWGGSHAELLAFGIACAKTERWDTAIPDYLSQALGTIASEVSDWRPFFRSPVISKLLLRTQREMLERATNPEAKRDLSAMTGIYGWMTGDYEAGYTQLRTFYDKKTGWNYPKSSFKFTDEFAFDIHTAYVESYALGGPWKELFNKIEKHRLAGEFDAALEAAKAAADAEKPDVQNPLKSENAFIAFTDRVRLEKALRKGGWAFIPLNFPLVNKMGGHWKLSIDEHRAAVTSTAKNSGNAILRVELGVEYEVRGKVILPEGGDPASFHFWVGYPGIYGAIGVGNCLQISIHTDDHKTSKQRIGPMRGFLERSKETDGPAVKDENTFLVRRAGGKLSVWVNDKVVIEDMEMPEEVPSGEGAFSIGGRTYGKDKPVVFKDLEARFAND